MLDEWRRDHRSDLSRGRSEGLQNSKPKTGPLRVTVVPANPFCVGEPGTDLTLNHPQPRNLLPAPVTLDCTPIASCKRSVTV